jgi:SAM-dependent methyltransferase
VVVIFSEGPVCENGGVDRVPQSPPQILSAARRYWIERAAERGSWNATHDLMTTLWEFLCESTPSRLRSRFGDADYDWDYRVNTTSGAVGWRDRLLGVFHSPYQPTEPQLFRDMIATLQERTRLNFADFTFLDLGSGKGRTLLMASDFPFRRILGVELLPTLHAIAEQNLGRYRGQSQQCFSLESVCADAGAFSFPEDPLVLYLFNPLPEAGLRRVLGNLRETLAHRPRAAFVVYHNPQLEPVLVESGFLSKIAGTDQYSIFASQN